MFMLHVSVSVLVSLLSFSAAAPTTDDCSQLVQSLTVNELHQILGKWILIEGFAKNDILGPMLGSMKSLRLEVNTTADNQTLLLNLANQMVPPPHQPNDQCFRSAINVTLINGKVLEVYLAASRSYYKFLQTCPDCLLMQSYNKENDYQMLFLFGRNKTLAASDLETSRKQAACLQFPQPAKFQYDTNNELCPVGKRSDSTLREIIL